jgi:crotonobetainyl-CoA:carnitine CoA-transferase CaiB-like acyl-CoA transferase
MAGPLSRFKVLDLTRARSGPSCVRQFADWGADVLTIEAPGDEAFGGRDSGDFQNLHRNKNNMTLDVRTPEGKAIFYKLIPEMDVLVENFRPDVKFRLGIDFETVHKINPRLVYGSISGFGEEGPYRVRPGLDQIAQGMGGHMAITGLPGQGPVRSGAAISDVSGGLYCALGIMTALLEREVTGKGRWVRTSLLQAQMALLDFQAARYLVDGIVPGQEGNNHPTSGAMGLFDTADDPINIAVTGQGKWLTFAKLIDRADLVDDPRYADGRKRNQHKHELNEQIQIELSKKPSKYWVDALNEAGIPCGPVYKMDQMFADPHIRQLDMVKSVESKKRGKLNLLAQPFTYSDGQMEMRMAAPEKGEHTETVLARLGYDDAGIAALRARKVI